MGIKKKIAMGPNPKSMMKKKGNGMKRKRDEKTNMKQTVVERF